MASESIASQPLQLIYVEVTNRCNLDCSICIRNTWDDVPGMMSFGLYQKLIDDARLMDPLPEIFFSGYGEPLSHPEIIQMVQLAKESGFKTSLITNGTLLSRDKSEDLISTGLDRLWVSLDGAHAESYQDIQLGEYLPQILQNLQGFQELNASGGSSLLDGLATDMGIAFVLMKKNAADLTKIVDIGWQLSIKSFFFTFLEAYSEEQAQETVYPAGISRHEYRITGNHSGSAIQNPDLRAILTDLAQKSLEYGDELHIDGPVVERDPPVCPFVDRGAIVVRWDGEVSPCLPLLYNHFSFVGSWKRRVYSHSYGNIRSNPILDLWFSPEYKKLRKRLLDKSFSPCVSCRDCWLSEDNLLDCMGYDHPTCGGCLWAEGLISCP